MIIRIATPTTWRLLIILSATCSGQRRLLPRASGDASGQPGWYVLSGRGRRQAQNLMVLFHAGVATDDGGGCA